MGLDKPCADNVFLAPARGEGRQERRRVQRCVLESLGPRSNSALIAPFPRLALGKPRSGSFTCPGRKPGVHGKFKNPWICSHGQGKCLLPTPSPTFPQHLSSFRWSLLKTVTLSWWPQTHPVAITLASTGRESCCGCDRAESRSPRPLCTLLVQLDSGLCENGRDNSLSLTGANEHPDYQHPRSQHQNDVDPSNAPWKPVLGNPKQAASTGEQCSTCTNRGNLV